MRENLAITTEMRRATQKHGRPTKLSIWKLEYGPPSEHSMLASDAQGEITRMVKSHVLSLHGLCSIFRLAHPELVAGPVRLKHPAAVGQMHP